MTIVEPNLAKRTNNKDANRENLPACRDMSDYDAIGVIAIYYENSMKDEVVLMQESASQLEELRSQSQKIKLAATVLENKSKANEESGKKMEKHAQALEKQSEKEFAAAKNDEAAAAALEDQAKEENSGADAYQAKAKYDEDAYQADTQDATKMTAAAVSDKELLEGSDNCNFFSKMWGCRETEKERARKRAVEETAKAAEDLRAAAAAKEDEQAQLKKAANLRNKATQDAKTAADLETQAEQEISRAEEERNEAIDDESKAEALFKESKEEWKEAMDKEAKIEQKKAEANKLHHQTKQHKVAAFKHSLVGLISAMIVLIYFTLSLFLDLVVFMKSREMKSLWDANEEVRLLQGELDSKSYSSFSSSSKQSDQSQDDNIPSEVDALLKVKQSPDEGTISFAQDESTGSDDDMEVVIVRSTSDTKDSLDALFEGKGDEFTSDRKCEKVWRILAKCMPYWNVLFEVLAAAW
eukprot:CAMPEP_0185724028 /NCGR_PEP_ID=MMETSP1171-20130828/643_1 /TAXON_ID=374046 /ORGANISM="Helicotheca tamensis, Strain CCMP826" /LENGTH=468 /DNA_ID=CAMNT_0028391801 /DNA_START=117 /DNA_END=1521 /DNA_ORIENTATION=+